MELHDHCARLGVGPLATLDEATQAYADTAAHTRASGQTLCAPGARPPARGGEVQSVDCVDSLLTLGGLLRDQIARKHR
jgi:hypothetical protein